jgi:hypothetical protein
MGRCYHGMEGSQAADGRDCLQNGRPAVYIPCSMNSNVQPTVGVSTKGRTTLNTSDSKSEACVFRKAKVQFLKSARKKGQMFINN